MFTVKLAVLSAVLALTLSADVKNEDTKRSAVCQEEMARLEKCIPHVEVEIFGTLTDAIRGKINAETVLKVTEKSRKGIECLGNVTCEDTRYIKYVLEGAVFAENKIFGGASECVKGKFSELTLKIQSCVDNFLPTGKDVSLLGKEIAKCTAKSLNCSDVAKNIFYQGALAIADFFQTNAGIREDASGNFYLGSFNKKFNPEYFIHQHL